MFLTNVLFFCHILSAPGKVYTFPGDINSGHVPISINVIQNWKIEVNKFNGKLAPTVTLERIGGGYLTAQCLFPFPIEFRNSINQDVDVVKLKHPKDAVKIDFDGWSGYLLTAISVSGNVPRQYLTEQSADLFKGNMVIDVHADFPYKRNVHLMNEVKAMLLSIKVKTNMRDTQINRSPK